MKHSLLRPIFVELDILPQVLDIILDVNLRLKQIIIPESNHRVPIEIIQLPKTKNILKTPGLLDFNIKSHCSEPTNDQTAVSQRLHNIPPKPLHMKDTIIEKCHLHQTHPNQEPTPDLRECMHLTINVINLFLYAA
jgi:hypothetical protein